MKHGAGCVLPGRAFSLMVREVDSNNFTQEKKKKKKKKKKKVRVSVRASLLAPST